VFGFSFSELLMICIVALVFVGPKKLPGMLHSLGQFLRKLRNMTNDVRNQTGIDQLLRAEGMHGGLNELRGLLRGNHGISLESLQAPLTKPSEPSSSESSDSARGGSEPLMYPRFEDPYAHIDLDTTREYPPEGPDAYGALPDDLLGAAPSSAKAEEAPEPAPEATAETTTTSA
jgi:sec-independent protein translocase protein TatB